MYSVIRFSPVNRETGDMLAELWRVLKEAYPDLEERNLSASLSHNPEWGPHLEDILTHLRTMHEIIDWAKTRRLEIEVDIAIEPEDREGLAVKELYLEPAVMRVLGDQGVLLVVSLY